MALRPLVDKDRARRIDVMAGARMIASGEPGGEPLLERYRELVGPDRSSADAMFLAEVVAPRSGSCVPARPPTSCSPISSGICAPGVPSARW